MIDLNEIWKKTLAQIEVKIDSAPQFRTWFKDTRLIKIENGKATIGVKNAYAAEWLARKHRNLIETMLNANTKMNLKAIFVFDKEISIKNEISRKDGDKENSSPILEVKQGIDKNTIDRIKQANLNEKYDFNNYIVGPSNRLAHAAGLAVVDNPGKSYNPLFIYGDTGLGKTHLMQAIGRAILEKDSQKKVLYCTTESFLIDVVTAIRKNKTEELRKKYRELDALLIDDVHQIAKAKETQSEFFNTFNVLFHDSKQIIITSDRSPDEIPNIEKRLISRFKGGMVCDISKPDFEERLAILEEKKRELNLFISKTVLSFIADLVTENIRELEGALKKVALYSTMKDGDLTNQEVARILGKDVKSRQKKLKINDLLKKIAAEFEVNVKDLRGERRTKEIALARQVTMYILRNELGYKLKDISTILRRKDHTTAIHAIEKVETLIHSNLTFKEQVDSIISSLTQKDE